MNPYSVLGVDRLASDEEIRIAHRRLSLQNHPDRNPGDKDVEIDFKIVQEAFAILSDPIRRQRYDDTGETNGTRQSDPMTEIMAVVASMFDSITTSMLQAGADPGKEDIVARMLEGLKDAAKHSQETSRKLNETKAVFRDIASRFSSKLEDGENPLKALALSRVEDIERRIANQKLEYEKILLIEKFITNFEYRLDRPKGRSKGRMIVSATEY